MTRKSRLDGQFIAFWSALAVAAIGVGSPSLGRAHFILKEPASFAAQDQILGLPQKSAPCGQADPMNPVAPTGAVTTFQQGQTLTVTIKEVIPHPGHYRILLAANQAALPKDPLVTPGDSPCGTIEIVKNPTLPLLADGVFLHTTPFTDPQSVQITLPPNMTCTHCTLQVVEFMSQHGLNDPGGCFYHHCADITIVPTASPDGGARPDASMTTTPPPAGQGGCGIFGGPARSSAPVGALLLLGTLMMIMIRRRQARRQPALCRVSPGITPGLPTDPDGPD